MFPNECWSMRGLRMLGRVVLQTTSKREGLSRRECGRMRVGRGWRSGLWCLLGRLGLLFCLYVIEHDHSVSLATMHGRREADGSDDERRRRTFQLSIAFLNASLCLSDGSAFFSSNSFVFMYWFAGGGYRGLVHAQGGREKEGGLRTAL